MQPKRPSDDQWFEAQLAWAESKERYGIALPSLPSEEVQTSFTAMSGRQNLLQGFEFYKVALQYISTTNQPKILDFGCGWGRVSRFFLRETSPKNLYLADAMEWAIRALNETNNTANIIHNSKKPPIKGLPEKLDLVFAYSVFSHMSEEYFRLWMDYFLKVLKPGGHVVFTTRGWQFIDHLQKLRDGGEDLPANLVDYVKRLREDMPTPARIGRIHSEGNFQWYTMAGGTELTSDFWGEAFIPESYLKRNYGSMLVKFTEEVDHVDQSIVVIRKPLE